MQLYPVLSIIFGMSLSSSSAQNGGSCKMPVPPKYGTLHMMGDPKVGNLALYSCDGDRELVGASVSKCLINGQWTSPPPKCKPGKRTTVATSHVGSISPGRNETVADDKVQDLPLAPKQSQEENCECTYNSHDRKLSAELNGLGLWHGDKVRKGDKMSLRCHDQTKHLVLPNTTSISGTLTLACDVCGTWEDSDLPSCETVRSENLENCTVPWILYGYIEEQDIGPEKYSWWKMKFERQITHRKVATGSIPSRTAKLFLVCQDQYVIQGTGASREIISCSEGRWSPQPVCIKANRTNHQMFRPQPSTYPLFTLREKSNLTDYQYVRPYVSRYPMPSVREETNLTDYQYVRPYVSRYPMPSVREETNLTDYQYVRPYVSRYPMPSVREERNLTDQKFLMPQISRYPIPTIREKTNLTDYQYVRPYVSRYPMPSVREETNLTDHQFFRPQSSRYPIPTIKEKTNLTDYQIFRIQSSRNSIPTIREKTNRTDHQMFRPQPSTYPFFTLREKSNLTDYKYVIANLTDYQYVRRYVSRYPMPSVREENILCPLIDEKDTFTVFYSDGRKINSTARVYCKDFNQQIAGLYNATCLSSGEWSYLNPECRVPMCTIKDFSEIAPKNLVLDLNGVDGELLPIGSELPLLCQKNMILHGNAKAKCGRHGQWSYGRSRCDPGCYLDPKSTSPELIIEPAKPYFSFGEHVKVLCPVGLKLTSNVEVLVCMGNSWSDEIPKCL